jgi:hypothetical protein
MQEAERDLALRPGDSAKGGRSRYDRLLGEAELDDMDMTCSS